MEENAGRPVVVRVFVVPAPAVPAMISQRVVPWPERGNMGPAWRDALEGPLARPRPRRSSAL